jgi:hypothetical protein
MTVIDKILSEWSYRCSDGIVDMNNPTKRAILNAILEENGVDLLKEDQNDDLEDIFDYLGNDKTLTKIQVFDRLAEYTQKYFSSEMGELRTVFPEVVNTIINWRREELVPERESNIGKEVETCIINYSNKIKNIKASDVANKGRGQDAVIGGKIVEIKSSKGNTINTQLQTTWYSPTKFYAFVTNTSSNDIEVRIVYGEILIKLSLGQELASTGNLDEMSDKLELQIKDGLSKLDFANMIKTSLITKEPVDRETSFKIGNRLKVRFVIYFEPAYGKERNKKANEELDENYYEED